VRSSYPAILGFSRFMVVLASVAACGSRGELFVGQSPGDAATSDAPRLLAPLSTSTVTSQSPTLRWVPAQSGATTYVDVCRDRACATVEQTLSSSDGSVRPDRPLAPGVHYWRARSAAGSSATWELFVGVRSAPTDTSWGSTLDVNGDGFADLAVDAVSVDENTGAVYVFEGSASGVSTTPTATLMGPDGKEGVFAFVANAGDVNGDGFADLAVGATGLSNSTAVSHVYVYYGGASGLASSPSATLAAPDGGGTWFGAAVAGAGDVNGDGYGDLLVGAPNDSSREGVAYVYFGGLAGPTLGYTLTPPEPMKGEPALFGGAVSSAGDVDGDGLADFIVAAAFQGGDGEAYLYRGDRSGARPPPAVRLTTATTGEDPLVSDSSFGTVVACADDVNGDGYADVIVTADWTNDRRSGTMDVASNDGRVYLYLGSSAGITDRPATELEGPGTYAFGHEAASAGDVNGDGYADLVLGAYGDGHTASVMGNAFVYLGGPAGVAHQPATSLDGPDGTGGFFGKVSQGRGDLDGDGYADLVVAAYEALGGTGRVYVFPGSRTGVPIAPVVTLTGPADSNFGATLD
jgi:hypothetical protein